MKKTILLSVVLLFMFGANAQKIKVTEGNLKFLKGEELIDIVFTYDEKMKVGKMTEKAYIKKKMKDVEDSDKVTPEEWKAMWYEDRSVHFEPMFTELINDYSDKADVVYREGIDGAKYKMIVNTTFIEPGFNIGITKKKAAIDLEIIFVPVDDDSKILAKIILINSPGRSTGYGDFDTGIRVGEAYAKAGKEMAKFLIKKGAF